MPAGTVRVIANTMVPVINIGLAKALDFEEPISEWQETVKEVDVTSAPSDTHRFPVFTTPALPRAKAKGAAAEKTGQSNYLQDMTFTVLSIEENWPNELKQDLPDFDTHVRRKATETGTNYAERVYQWRTSIMAGSAVESGLPAISTTSYDGQNLYSTSTRFRTSGGNTISGSGVNTGAACRDDYFSALTRFSAFKHDQSDAKLWNRPESETMLVEFPPSLWSQMVEAFEAEYVRQSGGYTQSAQNTFLVFSKTQGGKVVLLKNAYLTGNSWYITIMPSMPDRRMMALGKKAPPKAIPLTEANAADMARTYSEGVVMHGRLGLTPLFPGSTIKVSNS